MTEVELYPGHVSPLGVGSIPLDEVLKYTGLELLRRLIDGLYPAAPIGARMNFALVEAGEPGVALVQDVVDVVGRLGASGSEAAE